MPQYAKNTNVSSELSRIEIEKILVRYGAENFAYATASGKSLIGFSLCNRQVKFILPLPKIEDFSLTKTARKQAESGRHDALECAHWQRCCALQGIPFFQAYVISGKPLEEFKNLVRKSDYENGYMPEILMMLEE